MQKNVNRTIKTSTNSKFIGYAKFTCIRYLLLTRDGKGQKVKNSAKQTCPCQELSYILRVMIPKHKREHDLKTSHQHYWFY